MSQFILRGMLAAAVVAMTLSAATAQDRERGGRRGFSGFGGFGGGAAGLLRMEEVQKELGLSEADAEKILSDIRALAPERGAGGDRESFRNLSDEERQKRREEMRKQFEELAKKTDEKIEASLTDSQYKRLGELRIQREGVAALSRDDVAEKLKLTAEQKEKIAKLQEEGRPQFGRGRRGGDGNEGNAGERPNFEEIRARREKLNADILAVLTPEQKTAWENMQGAKFEFPQRGFGGPGREGGRRNRGSRPDAE